MGVVADVCMAGQRPADEPIEAVESVDRSCINLTILVVSGVFLTP